MSRLDLHLSQWDAIPHPTPAVMDVDLEELPSARAAHPLARARRQPESPDRTQPEPRRAVR